MRDFSQLFEEQRIDSRFTFYRVELGFLKANNPDVLGVSLNLFV